MRLSTVVCNISITIHGLSPNSRLLISLEPRTGVVKSIDLMSDKAQYAILTDAVAVILSDVIYGPRCSNCWLPASIWVEAINKMNHIDASIGVDVRRFNTSMIKSHLFGESMNQFDGSNTTGFFHIKFAKTLFYSSLNHQGRLNTHFLSTRHGATVLLRQP